jgi:hypothetical protein
MRSLSVTSRNGSSAFSDCNEVSLALKWAVVDLSYNLDSVRGVHLRDNVRIAVVVFSRACPWETSPVHDVSKLLFMIQVLRAVWLDLGTAED